MSEADSPPEIPEPILDWAREREGELGLIVKGLLETGEWPTTTGLTRELARAGNPVPLASILDGMPKPLGFIERPSGRIVLLLPGLSLAPGAEPLLGGFLALLHIAVERYKGEDDTPLITSADLARVPLDEHERRAVSEIFLREAPFTGSGTGSPDEDWSREITEQIVHYWDVNTPAEYIRIRLEQLRSLPQYGLRATAAAAAPEPPAGEQRDVFISHASEDKDEIARPLAEALLARHHTVWFDEYELTLGDSLRQEIEKGLAHSRLGVVILSQAFFAKNWPQQELNALYARLISGEPNVIVPIWHRMTREQVAARAPLLADLLAGDSTDGAEHLAQQVGRTLERRHGARPAIDTAPAPQPSQPDPADHATDQDWPPLGAVDAAGPQSGSAPPGTPHPGSAPTLGGRPALGAVNFDMEPGVLNIAALELTRDGDTIALRHLFNDAIARARTAIEAKNLETLSELLDRLTCLAATFLTLDQDQRVLQILDVLSRIYAMPLREGDAERFGYSTQISPQEFAPNLWFEMLQRLYGLGALAVRYENWGLLRAIGTQKPQPATDYERNWLRHALTMSSRAELLRETRDERTVEISLLALARTQIERLACLRPDGLAPNDDAILTSLAQFDALWNLTAIDDSTDASGRDFYPNFARFYSRRVTPAVEELLTPTPMRQALFKRSDEDLALALLAVGNLAAREGWQYDGFTGWDPQTAAFIDEHLPEGTTR